MTRCGIASLRQLAGLPTGRRALEGQQRPTLHRLLPPGARRDYRTR
jgi:hypothetical protein